jgi:hypothetical protein
MVPSWVQIEPVWIGVDLHHLVASAGDLEDGLEIDLVRLAAVDQPAGRMRDGRYPGIFERSMTRRDLSRG